MAAKKKKRADGERPSVKSSVGQEIDRAARPIFLGALPRAWIPHDLGGPDDYGIDYEVEIFESFMPVGIKVAIQLKGIESPTFVDNCISFSFPTKNLGTYVDKEDLAVFLVVTDVGAKRSYFVCLQEYALDVLRDEQWIAQESITIHVPLANAVEDTKAFRQAAGLARQRVLAERAAPAAALRARAARYERLDPRFKIIATATAQSELYELQPIVEVQFGVRLSGVDAARVRLLRRGYAVKFAPGEVAFTGMPILADATTRETLLKMSAESTTTMDVSFRRRRSTARLERVPATVTVGLDAMRIEAAYPEVPLDISIEIEPVGGEGSRNAQVRVRTIFGLARWTDQAIDSLPLFDTIDRCARLCAREYELSFVLHGAHGQALPFPWGPIIPASDFGDYVEILDGLLLAREIARLKGVRPKLPATFGFRDVDDLRVLHAIVTKGEYRGSGEAAVFSATTRWSKRLQANESNEPGSFSAQFGGVPQPHALLDQELQVPLERITLTRATVRVERQDGGTALVTATGAKGCRFEVVGSSSGRSSPAATEPLMSLPSPRRRPSA